MVQHGAERTHGEALQVTDVNQKDGQTLGAPTHLRQRGGTRQQEHQVGLQHPRDKDFLPIHYVRIAVPHRCSLQLRGVRTRIRFGHAKGLQAQGAIGDLWQIARLLRLRTMAQQRAHNVHLRVAGGGIAAGMMHFLQNKAGLQDA